MITFGSIGQLCINGFFALNNRSQVEIMEDMNHNIFDTGSKSENFAQLFGNGPKLSWLIPTVAEDLPTDGHNFYFHYYTL